MAISPDPHGRFIRLFATSSAEDIFVVDAYDVNDGRQRVGCPAIHSVPTLLEGNLMPDDIILDEEQLQSVLDEMPGWEVRDGWLRKKYRTKGWPHTLMVTNAIGYLAEAANHHPDLELGYAQVVMKIQTHRVRAITESDVALAKQVDRIVTWQPDEKSPLDGQKKWVD